ncbi:MAG: TCR/Tet family MFS transporter [Gammaproteobacteria bacterium]
MVSPAPPTTAAPAPRPAAFVFVFITVLLDMLALGMVLPVLPKLIESFVGGDTARAAHFVGIFGTTWALMQFLFSPVLGALSDRFGRRPVILLSNAGLGLNYLLQAVVPSLGWLFAGRVLSGITAASVSTANAYVSDITPPAERAARFGLLGAAFGAGFVIGPGLGGLLGAVDLRFPFWAAGVLSLANFVYGWFVLPESLPRDRRTPFSLHNASPWGSLRLLGATADLRRLTAMSFLFNLAQYALNSVFVLYAGYRYHWGPWEVGVALMVVGASSALVQGGLMRPLRRHLDDRQLLAVGISCGVIGFLALGLAPSGAWFLVAVPLNALWGLAGPAGLALITQRTGGDQHGRVQGGLSSLAGIAGLAGPVLFTSVFGFAITRGAPLHLPGAPFLLAALLVIGGLLTIRPLLRRTD